VSATVSKFARERSKHYPMYFYLPIGLIYGLLFVVPTFTSFYYSMTRWNLFGVEFIGFENFLMFFQDPFLINGLIHTFIYAFLTSGLKVVIGMVLGVILTSNIAFQSFLRNIVFFPVLVSTIGIGLTFQSLMKPETGVINEALNFFGLPDVYWLTDPAIALYSVIAVDVWKGVGLATVIYIAGIASIPTEYSEAAKIDGAGVWHNFRHITLPLLRPATNTVIILSLIGGLRSFDLIWAMTQGGPGFASDVIASVIYKNYQAGFYGLSTAGNVVLFILIAILILPLSRFLTKREIES
jgi:raffinose/stachyose/melibiose transport system permease protein